MSLYEELEKINNGCAGVMYSFQKYGEYDLNKKEYDAYGKFTVCYENFRQNFEKIESNLSDKTYAPEKLTDAQNTYSILFDDLTKLTKALSSFRDIVFSPEQGQPKADDIEKVSELVNACDACDNALLDYGNKAKDDLKAFRDSMKKNKPKTENDKKYYNKENFKAFIKQLKSIAEEFNNNEEYGNYNVDDSEFSEYNNKYPELPLNIKKTKESAEAMLAKIGNRDINELTENEFNDFYEQFDIFKENSEPVFNNAEAVYSKYNEDDLKNLSKNDSFFDDEDTVVGAKVYLSIKNAKNNMMQIDDERKNELDAASVNNVNEDFKEFLDKIEKVDPKYIRSSENFRKAKAAISEVIKMTDKGVTEENRKNVNKKIIEALDYCELYTEVKSKENKRSNLANKRLDTMISISKQIDIIAKKVTGDLYKTNQQVEQDLKKSDTSRLTLKEAGKIDASKRYLSNSGKTARFNQKRCDAYIKQNPVNQKQAVSTPAIPNLQ